MQAAELYDRSNRPLPAERLIREAMAIYEGRGDKAGLADAYSEYGFFFRSPSIARWQHVYRSGFLDKDATYDSRYERSIYYFRRAAELYRDVGRPDHLTNVEFNMGMTYALMHKNQEACSAYAASTAAERQAKDTIPSYRPAVPPGFVDWETFIADAERRLGCST